uniref:HEAT repeat-containing protein 1 n=1 Tax=Anolis carolinensis TaxID=28377 RepID=A0A803SWL1_ANOCA
MTSLAHQLKRLALPQNDPSLLSRSEAASLLFDCKEAANIDRETFFAIGCTGLEELIGIDASFETFQPTLFSQMSKGLERSVQTKAVNQQLDESISSFLIHLSPYFMLKPAQKCLEWLIHRFHIHLYNQDSLVGCVLPYHETKLFVRVIQLLKISDPTHKWHWLHPIQKPGVPLARGTLITHCYKDLGFMDFICRLVTKSVKVFSAQPESLPHMRVLFTFYASTVVSALGAAANVTDTLVSKLLPYIQKGLKSSLVDYRAATYMIICQLAVKMTMENSLVHSLALQISKTLVKTPLLIKEGLSCLIILLQSQKEEGLGEKPFKHLCKVPNLTTTLHEISTNYDISPILHYMFPHMVHSVIYGETEESDMVGNQICKKHLEAIITNIPLEKNIDHVLACLETGCLKMFPKMQCPFFIYGRYSKTLDLVLEQYLKDVRNPKEQDLFHQFISLSLSGGKYQFLKDTDTSLLLSLNHPQPAVRLLAVRHLDEMIDELKEGFDDSFIEEAILARLKDDNLEVVNAALSTLETFSEQIGYSLLSLIERADLSKNEKWCGILDTAIQILIRDGILKKNKDLLNQLVLQLLPYIVITINDSKSSEWKVALCIAQSNLCSLHPLLKGWPETFQEVVKAPKTENLIYSSNGKLIKFLSENLILEDPSSLSQMVQGLIDVAKKEPHNVKQKVTMHVISAVLVQSCCGSYRVEECRSSLALKVFHLLRRKMQNFKDKMWWNPETLNRKNKDYLNLLLGLFDSLLSGASEGNNTDHFRTMMRLLFEVHLKKPEDQFRFLSVLWTYSYNISNQLNFVVDAMLQTRALYIGCAMLASQSMQTKRKLALTASPVIVSLLINLGSPVSEVRRAALCCLNSLSGIKESPFHPIVIDLVQKAEEITSDQTYIIQSLGNLFEELHTQPKGKPQPQKLSEALGALLECVKSITCPSYVARNMMKLLQEVNGKVVLSHLLPVIDRLLDRVLNEPDGILKDEALLLHIIIGKYNEHSAELLCTNQRSLGLFIKALHTSQEVYKGLSTFQMRALGQVTKSFFAALSDGKVQQKILGVLFDLLLNCKNPDCAQMIGSVFKAISVDAEQVSVELEPLQKSKNIATVHQKRKQKMQQQRKAQDQECAQEESSVNWQRVTLILELLQHKKKLKRPQALIPTLFSLLARCLEPSAVQENLEYVKQLILGGLLNICQKLSPDGNRLKEGVLDEEKFNVELIVQCIRVSEMPQTHHHALLLLGTAAGMFPGKVLHNIMPIFTFMGANVMRLDDAYSFQVINKTVKMVIPALIQENSGPSETAGDLEGIVIKIIRVFVDALPHVPEHRRLPILEQLISTLGGERFLWILLVLLFEQHVTKSVAAVTSGEKDTVLENDTEFWISVCCEFSAVEQLQSLMGILSYLTKLPENKEVCISKLKSRQHRIKSSNQESELFNVESHSGKQLRHFKFISVSFMSQLLASHSFVKKVRELHFSNWLLEDVLRYINVVAHSVEKNADSLTAKFWRALLNKSYDVLDKVNSLMPTETFIPIIRGLMTNQLPSVRRKAMDLLNNKLQQRTQWQPAQVDMLLDMVPELIAVVQQETHRAEEEQAINRQTALFSLKLLCKCFGHEKHEPFTAVLKMAVDVIASEEKEERNVTGSALLCAAEVTCILKALAIPQLPRLMPALLNILKHTKELAASEIYLLSAVTALLKIVETLPHFLSPYLLHILLQVVHLEKIAAVMGPSSQVHLRLDSLKTTLATKLPPRVLLPAVAKCYSEVSNTHKTCLGAVMDILKEHIVILERDQLSAHQSELTSFFVKALDFRTEHSQDDLEEVGEVEGHIIMCLISMIMKLSEMSFRPLFFKLFDWAKTEGAPKDRLLTFCRLSDCIAKQLKGLFTLFAGHLVKPFADILNEINTCKTDKAFFESENNTEKSCLLLQFILDCLHKIFLFDSHQFVSKERAETLMMPLAHQVLINFCMADDSLWNASVNYQILLQMRHESPKVRFAALLALLEFAEKIRENYMVLLPEAIPFLAELMEGNQSTISVLRRKILEKPLYPYKNG